MNMCGVRGPLICANPDDCQPKVQITSALKHFSSRNSLFMKFSLTLPQLSRAFSAESIAEIDVVEVNEMKRNC